METDPIYSFVVYNLTEPSSNSEAPIGWYGSGWFFQVDTHFQPNTEFVIKDLLDSEFIKIRCLGVYGEPIAHFKGRLIETDEDGYASILKGE